MKRGEVKLTARRREVLHWLAMGKSNTEIGEIMGVTRFTIHTLINALKRYYGVNTTNTRMGIVMSAIVRDDIDPKKLLKSQRQKV